MTTALPSRHWSDRRFHQADRVHSSGATTFAREFLERGVDRSQQPVCPWGTGSPPFLRLHFVKVRPKIPSTIAEKCHWWCGERPTGEKCRRPDFPTSLPIFSAAKFLDGKEGFATICATRTRILRTTVGLLKPIRFATRTLLPPRARSCAGFLRFPVEPVKATYDRAYRPRYRGSNRLNDDTMTPRGNYERNNVTDNDGTCDLDTAKPGGGSRSLNFWRFSANPPPPTTLPTNLLYRWHQPRLGAPKGANLPYPVTPSPTRKHALALDTPYSSSPGYERGSKASKSGDKDGGPSNGAAATPRGDAAARAVLAAVHAPESGGGGRGAHRKGAPCSSAKTVGRCRGRGCAGRG